MDDGERYRACKCCGVITSCQVKMTGFNDFLERLGGDLVVMMYKVALDLNDSVVIREFFI
jgi:hypothetical protein